MALVADSLVLGVAYVIAGLLVWPIYKYENPFQADRLFSAVMLPIALLSVLGGYRAVVRFIGLDFGLRLAAATVGGSLLSYNYLAALGDGERSLRVTALYALLAFLMVALQRFATSYYLRPAERGNTHDPILIYGAGAAGHQLASSLAHSSRFGVLGFVDDNPALWNRMMNGVRVYSTKDLPELCLKKDISKILLAMPSITKVRQREILQSLESLTVQIMVMPDINDLASGKKQIDDFRPVQIEDLLGREPVPPIESLLNSVIRGRCVMVTGAGGSIGSELCRLALKSGARCLVLFENSEYALYTIEQELAKDATARQCELIPLLGSVTDRRLLKSAFNQYAVETLYHAAAYKHVPLVERNIAAAVQNNILGTWATAETALEEGVKHFVLVSTDKAVRPAGVMGATKRVCELIVQGLAEQYPGSRAAIVRFGNVLGSSGSVVPAFIKQIQQGGPVTVTHPEVTRYFMTIQEAAQLVVQAGAMGHSGEIFVLDMGEPVRIRDLAERMIRLSGMRVRTVDMYEGDMEILYTGLRPGEKLYEELLIDGKPESTNHPRIFRAHENMLDWPKLKQSLNVLSKEIDSPEQSKLLSELRKLVESFDDSGTAESNDQAVQTEKPKYRGPASLPAGEHA